jgi:hypothetical protein
MDRIMTDSKVVLKRKFTREHRYQPWVCKTNEGNLELWELGSQVEVVLRVRGAEVASAESESEVEATLALQSRLRRMSELKEDPMSTLEQSLQMQPTVVDLAHQVKSLQNTERILRKQDQMQCDRIALATNTLRDLLPKEIPHHVTLEEGVEKVVLYVQELKAQVEEHRKSQQISD